MSRRHRAEKREIIPDAKFGDQVVSKFMNSVMHAGKKSVAEAIVYGAFETIETKTKSDPIKVFEQALDNVMPPTRRHLSGAGRGSHHSPAGARHSLDHRGSARTQRKDDDRPALRRAARCFE